MARKTTTAKRQAVARGDQTPEAKATQAEKKAATEKLFTQADMNAARGLPEGMTAEQHENLVRKAAVGF